MSVPTGINLSTNFSVCLLNTCLLTNPRRDASMSATVVKVLCVAVLVLSAFMSPVQVAVAGDGSYAAQKRYFLRSQDRSWHSAWYDPSVGMPMALVVPPTAEFQSQYSWGVPSSRTLPIYHQFLRPSPGSRTVSGRSRLRPTPKQPSDTVQFGVAPVRGPW
jgi:hypothetical protein